MENVAATQLPFLQKGILQLHSKQKTLKMPKSRFFHLKQRMQQSGPLEHGMLGLHRECSLTAISVEEQQLGCITDLSAIKIEEMSEQQLIYFILKGKSKKETLQLIYSVPPILTSKKLSTLK